MNRPPELASEAPLRWSAGTGCQVWAMFQACIAGDLAAVQRLVAEDPGLLRCQWSYRTPLYFAVRENQLAVAAYLLERTRDPLALQVHGTFLELARDRGHSAMAHLLETKLAEYHNCSSRGEPAAAAIRAGDLEALLALLDGDPERLHAGDARSNQPLHWAVMTRQPAIIDALLARGADLTAQRADGARPIHLFNGDYHHRGWRDVPADRPTAREVLDHLLARGAEMDIWTAAHLGDLDRVRAWLDDDPTLANRNSAYQSYYLGCGSALRNAAAGGHLEIARLLLARGADPNLPEEGIAPYGHALYTAAAEGHHELARLLLEHGAEPNAPVESSADPLSRAISNGDQPMIELLCQYGAAREVHLLAYYGDVRTAAAMFAANPALADDPEALGNAAGEGHEPFVRLMLRYQPELARRLRGWAKTRELTELLFAHGLEASGRDWLEITPLHQLARRGELDLAELFCDQGADLTARDDDLCSTPLGWAARFGQRAMVELLLRRGAPTHLPDDPAWATPLAWAERRGHADIAEVLRAHGAN